MVNLSKDDIIVLTQPISFDIQNGKVTNDSRQVIRIIEKRYMFLSSDTVCCYSHE
ncbi:hypothetical protein [Paenibacillus chitinolyticus]